MPTTVAGVKREHLEAYIVDKLRTGSPGGASNRYRALQQFFKWLVDEGEIAVSPMAKMEPPKVPQALVPVIPDDALAKLLEQASSRGFADRRDRAIMLVLLDTGVRLGGLVGLKTDDVDLHKGKTLTVTLKGGRRLLVPIGAETCKALDRYMRDRAWHPDADTPWLWLGERGRLLDSGIYQMLKRRGRRAGVEGLHPHRFRHTFAHQWLAAEGSEQNLMAIAGWESPQMLQRYARSTREQRARAAHRELSPADRLLRED
jgi:site-specific recombinase XerD